MSAATDYLENRLIDLIFRGQALAPPVLWVALFVADPTDSGNPGAELSTGAYGRAKACAGASQALTDWASTQGNTAASSGSGGLTNNLITITFPQPSADWGTVTHFALFDAQTGGNALVRGALNVAKSVNLGDPAPSFPPGSLIAAVA